MALDFKELYQFFDSILFANQGDHFGTLGLRSEYIEYHRAGMSMPYSEALIGDPRTRVVHGGAITSLLDTCCGFAAATALDDLAITPTIDFRIDYMRSATPELTIYADAEVYRVTESVIFTRATAHHGDAEHAIASAVGNFFRLDTELFDDMREEFRASQIQAGVPSPFRKVGESNE